MTHKFGTSPQYHAVPRTRPRPWRSGYASRSRATRYTWVRHHPGVAGPAKQESPQKCTQVIYNNVPISIKFILVILSSDDAWCRLAGIGRVDTSGAFRSLLEAPDVSTRVLLTNRSIVIKFTQKKRLRKLLISRIANKEWGLGVLELGSQGLPFGISGIISI